MDTDLPVPLSPGFLKVTRVRAQVCPRMCAPNLPLRNSEPSARGERGWPSWSALRGISFAGPPAGKQCRGDCELGLWSPTAAEAPPKKFQAVSGFSRTGFISQFQDCPCWARQFQMKAVGVVGGGLLLLAVKFCYVFTCTGAEGLGPEFCIPEIPRNYLDKKDIIKAPKSRQNGTLLVFDPKEKVMIGPNKSLSQKCCFVRRPRLASKLYSSPTQISLGVANKFSAKKEASSKKMEDKVSFKSTENRPSSRSIKKKDVLTSWQSDLWSSSFLTEIAGEAGKDAILGKQDKSSEYFLEDIEEKLSDSTDGDGDDDTNDDDDEGPTKKETRAPLELMAEFLRAEMGRDYQLAKKLCQMILIYEPENPVAKEFFSLIEEILLKEKAQKHEEDDEDSEEDTSSESEAESSEDASDDSSDECEDGS
ncbi:glutamate-rich protein 2 isoform X1 [Cricetulus griseus]|uniref:glutamate-rich protein 2 isoform X1 n=1 Tax=Cricetulus griseus TaxID=10029 RepID=UPI0015C381F7|nr:glutamate-rich protein 2 isoform X1 [Cricetulus griseus]